tara:strand:- start:19766 stop:19990 length:225 start_codon:yes stop_codon:yes gene_type:complete
MGFDRTIRNLIHKKQERVNIGKGKPRLSDMKEGVPEFRFTDEEQLCMYIRYNNKLWRTRFDSEGTSSVGITIEV